MKFYLLILGALTVWRITHLLNAEDGPRDIFVRLRRRAGGGLWGDLLDCFYCLSLWVAAPLAGWLGERRKERLLLWPALSAASILIERLAGTGRHAENTSQAVYFEGPEALVGEALVGEALLGEVLEREVVEGNQNVVLRKEERGREDAGRVH